MRAPLRFVYGNCVFASGLDDCWAAFAVETSTYLWLSDGEKHARLQAWTAALQDLEADVQILRVSRRAVSRQPLSAGRAEDEDGDGGTRRRSLARHLERQAARVGALSCSSPAVFVLVSTREPERDVASFLSQLAAQHPRAVWASCRRILSARPSLLSARKLEQARLRAQRAHARLAQHLPVRPARGIELQWLVRRAFCRGLAEPLLDELHEPRALAFERNGEAVLAPLEGDVLRWCDSFLEHRARSLRVQSESGVSWQAQLVLGALPERVAFPGARAELMFSAPESLPFGVDLSLNARFLPNELALRIARRRIQDADQIARAESAGEQGVSDLGYERTQTARDLLAYLQSASKPPLVRATLAVAVAAPDERQLEERVEACRRAYGEICLHRPLGEQLRLFLQHLPAQRTRVAGYDDTLTLEQVAAMMPAATHAAGSRNGFYLGHTLTGSRRPVSFNLREGSDGNRNATVLSVGALGSGKTTLAQKLLYEGFLLGARVVDCDPKGDHRFHLLEEVAPHVERIELRPDPGLRGLLDPLRVAPTHLALDATVSFLRDLLPGGAAPEWETAVMRAVDRVMRATRRPTCTEVVRALRDGDETDAKVGRALEVYARSGLTQLGFAEAAERPASAGERQVTYIAIRDLPAARPGTRRREYSQSERVGEQLVRLIAMFAAHLMSAERERLKLFSFDEGWRLLGDPVGRALLGSLQRMGRSELAVPIISTQLVADGTIGERESLENLLGATFVFGMRSEAEAARALSLLGLDADDARMRRFLLELDAGRCLFRDHFGRVEAIQVDLVAPALLQALSTTPGASCG